ncbi:hypothetical protein NM208_g9363 [Fusarium decemcellulare]|uniref:Uncharacterized protein n=1 Tax=Fusarium decemcellulare TaxID=57161 RepID=A0ACC1S223_9HYPO|nr:hypothetical protein NM208_g9363 [Fusarium decemcellulare]
MRRWPDPPRVDPPCRPHGGPHTGPVEILSSVRLSSVMSLCNNSAKLMFNGEKTRYCMGAKRQSRFRSLIVYIIPPVERLVPTFKFMAKRPCVLTRHLKTQNKRKSFCMDKYAEWIVNTAKESACYTGIFDAFPQANVSQGIQAIAHATKVRSWAPFHELSTLIIPDKQLGARCLDKRFYITTPTNVNDFQRLCTGVAEFSHRCFKQSEGKANRGTTVLTSLRSDPNHLQGVARGPHSIAKNIPMHIWDGDHRIKYLELDPGLVQGTARDPATGISLSYASIILSYIPKNTSQSSKYNSAPKAAPGNTPGNAKDWGVPPSNNGFMANDSKNAKDALQDLDDFLNKDGSSSSN